MSQLPEEQSQQIIVQKITKVNQQTGYKRYAKGKLLGKGGFAKCYEGVDIENKKHYAIKVMEKTSLQKSRAKQKLLSEIKIHKALHHRHIVEFDSVFQDSANVYIILELCTNKTLSQMVKKRKRLTARQTRYFLLQLISALQHLHANRVIHRDLKMGNIFLSQNMELKVGDFGLATKVEFIQEKKRTMCGTPNYIAPQIVEGAVGHSYEVDLWSTGVICYAMLYGRPPFETSQVKTTYKKIKNCQYTFPNASVPEDAKDFISKILVLDPKKRLTLKQMLDHTFLKSQEIPKFLSIQALTNIPSFKTQDGSTIKKVKTMEKLRPEDFGKRASGSGLDTLSSPRNAFNQQITERIKEAIMANQQHSNDHLLHVIAYVDYSTKYGLGYLTNNGFYGVHFNDSSVFAVNQQKDKVYLIQNATQKQDKLKTFPINQLPQDWNFQKKYQLLQRFILGLKQQVAKMDKEKVIYVKSPDFIYLKQWLKTKHAFMLRLSNKLFQVNFFDHSQILLNTQRKTVLFTSKQGNKVFETLPNALLTKDTELARRIKYTKQILNSSKKEKTQKGQCIQNQ